MIRKRILNRICILRALRGPVAVLPSDPIWNMVRTGKAEFDVLSFKREAYKAKKQKTSGGIPSEDY